MKKGIVPRIWIKRFNTWMYVKNGNEEECNSDILGHKEEAYHKTESEMLFNTKYTYESLSESEKTIYNMNTKLINKWIERLGLSDWSINTKQIDPQSVTYPDNIAIKDKFFVGIMSQEEALCATIFHDRDLTEEDVVHELLHVKYNDWSEDQVNKETEKLLNQKKDE